jgi:hypothetical protein
MSGPRGRNLATGPGAVDPLRWQRPAGPLDRFAERWRALLRRA